jgi:hypothetical protein
MGYSRSEVTVFYGSTSALDPVEIERSFTAVPSSPVKNMHVRLSAATGGTTLDLSSFTTILECYIKNHDTTNYVVADGRSLKSSKTFATNTLGFVDGGAGVADTITDTDSAFLSAQYLKAGDYVVVTGCSDAIGNNVTFGPLTAAVAGTITVPTAQVITAEAAEAGLVTMVGVSPFSEKILASQWVKLSAVYPANDLALTANTAACDCEILIIGT